MVQHALDQLGNCGVLFTDGTAENGAQGQGVGARRDESSAVGGVLDRVGKDECLLLIKVIAAEQGRQAYRQQGCDGRSLEADGVLGAAARADVVFGVFVGVVAHLGEDG